MTNEQLEIEKRLKSEYPDLHRLECPKCGELVSFFTRKVDNGCVLTDDMLVRRNGAIPKMHELVDGCPSGCYPHNLGMIYNANNMSPSP